jgi:trehalose 6-phosphate phosphatase
LLLAEILGLNGPDVVPFYIGDDVTDEDAFKALRGRGIGIVVSEAPRPTEASYWVQAPWEVYAFFERLLSLEGGGG